MSQVSTRVSLGIAASVAVIATTAATRPTSLFVPGLAFRVSSSTKVYGGDTPRGQDDEVMRVVTYSEQKDIKGREVRRTVGLARYGDSLPQRV